MNIFRMPPVVTYPPEMRLVSEMSFMLYLATVEIWAVHDIGVMRLFAIPNFFPGLVPLF